MARTILIVDDKVSLTKLVQEYLEEQGFRVVIAHNGRDAIYVARHEKPDLILLDIMMPEMDGYEFLKAYRRERTVPIILLTARLDESDKVLGLELGADDYVTKPFSMAELAARIRAVFRRITQDYATDEVLRIGNLALDKASRVVYVNDEAITLTGSEFELLSLLMTSPGRVFSRTELLDHLQGNNYEGVEKTINVHIHNLRNKIEPDAASPTYILTAFGAGYRCSTDDEVRA